MDHLRTMSVFVAVADNAGFAPAARQLNLSPPSVTRAVSELEARLGARLLHRTTRSVRLTDAGERYLADCRRILSDIDAAEQHAAGLHTKPSGLVTVTASMMFGHMVMAPVLLDLLNEYLDISVMGMFADRVVHMYEDGIDVAVRIADLPDSTLTAIRVGSVRTILCASKDYLAENGRPSHPSDLAEHGLIDFVNLTTAGQWILGSGSKAITIEPGSRFRVNSGEVAIKAALQGLGITRLLSYMITNELESGELEIVLADYEPAPVPVHVVHKEAGQTSARVRAVIDFLVAALRNHPAVG